MYERSSRSENRPTNSSRSACVRGVQCRASERLAVSEKSKMSLATTRTAARRSPCRPSFLRSGSSRIFTALSISARSWSVGAPAQARWGPLSAKGSSRASTSARASQVIEGLLSLHLAEDVFRQQLFEIDGRLDLTDLAVRPDELVRTARADADVFFADQPLRLDRRDRILLELDTLLHPEGDPGLVVGQADRLDPPDFDARDLHGGAGLEPAYRREVDGHDIAAAAQERDLPEADREIPERHDPENDEDSHRNVHPRALHQRSSERCALQAVQGLGPPWPRRIYELLSGSPLMNR